MKFQIASRKAVSNVETNASGDFLQRNAKERIWQEQGTNIDIADTFNRRNKQKIFTKR